ALRPNPWNGWLRDPDLLDWLADRFDEETYDWSASQLETYGRCPFLFLTSRYVLNLEELEEAEEETTPLTFGAAAHDILERFYREVKDDLPTAFTREARERLDRVCDQVFAEREAEGEWLGLPALWATAREKVRRHLHEYVDWELGYLADKNERPFQVEREFGFGDEAVWIEGRNSRGAPARMRLRGRIDRVDRAGVRKTVHHVLDYKSGGYPSKGGYLDGSTLQGALYLQALADQGFEVRKARYRVLKRPGSPQNGAEITFGSEEHETALTLALSIPARVRAGIFEAVAAAKAGWKPWDPGLEVRRNDAQIPAGHRFETSTLRVVEGDDDG
ncbi:MAG: PD-(D/E)XK nuclease family protein, partial [Acidobacteriota bacterium]